MQGAHPYWSNSADGRNADAGGVVQRFDLELLSEDDVFEIDAQAAHLFKHPHLGVDDSYDVWANDPVFYPAKPPAHWLMCAEVAGRVLVVPLAPTP